MTAEFVSVAALPTEVTSPVRFALVITVAAKLPVPLPVTPPVRVIVWSPVFVPDRLEAEIAPDRLKLVPVAAPITGVIKVGDVCITNVLPVPVCAPTEVVRPDEVIGPVRFPTDQTPAVMTAMPDELEVSRPVPPCEANTRGGSGSKFVLDITSAKVEVGAFGTTPAIGIPVEIVTWTIARRGRFNEIAPLASVIADTKL